MRKVRKGRWFWMLGITFLFLALYFFSQNGIQAQTEDPSKASPAQPPAPSAETEKQPLPALSQEEEEEEHPQAFDYLPKTKLGYVDWVAAIKQGVIKPRDSIEPSNPPGMPAIDFDVVFKVAGDLPDVVYPHFPHTLWLDCRNCHPSIFLMRAGANPVTMAKIFKGEFCGRCHGVVAFPISDCARCHSRPK